MSNRKKGNSFQNASGKLRIRMTNDYLFKMLLQKNENVLIALIAALLHLDDGEITSVKILNPILPGEDIEDKEIVLDVKVLLSGDRILDLEMQVVNEYNWPERSLYYACRNFANLDKGGHYDEITPVNQIGFLDFTLFEEHQSFYSTYKLMDTKDHHLYTDKFAIGIVDLTKVHLATREDRRYNVDKWAALFKAETWEEIRMLASQDQSINAAAETVYEINQDRWMRDKAEAREDYLRRQRGFAYREKKLREALSAVEKEMQEKDSAIAEKDSAIAEKDIVIAEKDRIIAGLMDELSQMKERGRGS